MSDFAKNATLLGLLLAGAIGLFEVGAPVAGGVMVMIAAFVAVIALVS